MIRGATVARIAYASSHVVLSVQPALGADSEFSRQLHSLASKRIPGIIAKEPEVNHSLSLGQDNLLIQIPGASNTA